MIRAALQLVGLDAGRALMAVADMADRDEWLRVVLR